MAEECRNCRFSRTMGSELACRRYPPTLLREHRHGHYPLVGPDWWCGEWLAMRPGAGLPAEIAPSPRSPGVTMQPGRAHRVEPSR
jgi:hypothetical protein